MEHDAKCEKWTVLGNIFPRFYEGMRVEDPQVKGMVKALGEAEDICACRARLWGFDLDIETGLKIGAKKAEKIIKSWLEQGDEAQDRRIKAFTDRVNGFNVIDLQAHRVDRMSD